jgi:hypothetical protein
LVIFYFHLTIHSYVHTHTFIKILFFAVVVVAVVGGGGGEKGELRYKVRKRRNI